MGPEIRRLERLSGTADSTADVVGLPFREVRLQIALAKSASEMLRQNVGTVRRRLEALEGDIGEIDDREAREAVRRQLVSMNESLQLRLDRKRHDDPLVRELT